MFFTLNEEINVLLGHFLVDYHSPSLLLSDVLVVIFPSPLAICTISFPGISHSACPFWPACISKQYTCLFLLYIWFLC